MDATIDTLQLNIIDNSDAVIASLQKLKTTLDGFKSLISGAGFAKLSKQLSEISAAANNVSGASKLKEFTLSLQELAAVPKANISKSLASQITAISEATANLDTGSLAKLNTLKNALQPLTELGKPQLTSFITQLKKLPDVATAFKDINMDAFAASIQKVTVAIRPLADEMAKVGAGFSALPTKIQRVIHNNEKLATSNATTGKSYGFLGTGINSVVAKFGIYAAAAGRAANVMGGWVKESNDYVENLNLFTVSMGEYADEALNYAKQVQKAMGIDMSEWIRNQGIFMQMGTGFGIAAEKAQLMSKALTQVAYDASSYFNASIETSLQKFQSGFAGELEPLRRWGYALDQATLQTIAYKNGIEQSIISMTRSQKAELLFIAIMEQSKNVMGDMGRTLMTPANAMRILKEQSIQLYRAFGNMLIPILIQFIPYVQAVVVVLTEAAQAIANLFGFTLPTIDYSSLGGLASGAEDIAGGFDDAVSSAKELKGMLAGFDELNIIQQKQEPAGGGAGIGGGDLGIDMSQFDYDFLGDVKNKTDEIAQSIRDFFGKWKDEIATVAKLLTGIWAVKKIADMVKWVKNLWAAFKTLTIVKTISTLFNGFLKTFDLFYASGAGFFKSFDKGIRSIGDSMLPMQKFLGSVVALGIEFFVVKDVIKDLTLGQKNWTEALLILIPTIGLVGTAMYAMLGPAGLVLTGVVGLTATLWGFNEAQYKIATDKTLALFYDGLGVSIGDLSDHYVRLFDEVTATNQPIIDNGNAIEASRQIVMDASRELDTLFYGIEKGVFSVEKELPKITTAFQSLYDNTISVWKDIENNIYLALAGSTGKAIEDLGGNLKQYADMVSEDVKQITKEMEGYKTLYEQSIETLKIDPENIQAFEDLKTAVSGLQEGSQTASSDMGAFSQSLKDTFLNIDFGDPKSNNFTKMFESISESAGKAKTSINEAKNQLDADLKMLQDESTVGSDKWNTYQLMREGNEIARQSELDLITGQFQTFLDQVQVTVVGGMKTQAEAASAEWNNLNWFEKWWNGGSEAAYVSKMMTNYKTNIGDPMDKALKEAIEATGLQGKTWTATAMTDILNGYFDYDFTSAGQAVNGFKAEIETVIGNAVPSGISNGMLQNMDLVTGAVKTIAQNTIDAGRSKDAFDINSPSKPFVWQGKSIVEGLQLGINENSYLAINAITDLANEITAQMDSILSSVKSTVSDIKDEIKEIQKATSGIGGNIDIGANFSINGYASGGFPSSGEFYMANENGASEWVGRVGNRAVVANNDQIVEGIAEGNVGVQIAIERAADMIIAAMERRGGVALGDRAIAEATQRGQSQLNRLVSVP